MFFFFLKKIVLSDFLIRSTLKLHKRELMNNNKKKTFKLERKKNEDRRKRKQYKKDNNKIQFLFKKP